jgi:hypothetical protein
VVIVGVVGGDGSRVTLSGDGRDGGVWGCGVMFFILLDTPLLLLEATSR